MEEIFAKWNENICQDHHASSLMILDRMLILAGRKIWTSLQIKMQILLLKTAIHRKAIEPFSFLTAACRISALNHSISLSAYPILELPLTSVHVAPMPSSSFKTVQTLRLNNYWSIFWLHILLFLKKGCSKAVYIYTYIYTQL